MVTFRFPRWVELCSCQVCLCLYIGFQRGLEPGAARGLLGSRYLVVKITDFTDFYPILKGFQRHLRKIRGLFYTQTGTTPGWSDLSAGEVYCIKFLVEVIVYMGMHFLI